MFILSPLWTVLGKFYFGQNIGIGSGPLPSFPSPGTTFQVWPKHLRPLCFYSKQTKVPMQFSRLILCVTNFLQTFSTLGICNSLATLKQSALYEPGINTHCHLNCGETCWKASTVSSFNPSSELEKFSVLKAILLHSC